MHGSIMVFRRLSTEVWEYNKGYGSKELEEIGILGGGNAAEQADKGFAQPKGLEKEIKMGKMLAVLGKM